MTKNTAAGSTLPMGRPGRVLVVDDEPGVLYTLAEFVRIAGHECFMAGGVAEARTVLEQQPVDVIISDIILPDASGTDFLHAVREEYPDIEVIMITGAPDAETAIDSLRGRAFDYLPKPVPRQRIINTLENALELVALRENNRRLEEHNRQYRENLEHLVESRTAELSLLSRRLMNIQESERDALSREIHDELGQSLIALKLNLQHLHQEIHPEPPILDECNRVLDYLDGIIDSCRRLSHRLSPLVLERLGLAKALERLIESLSRAADIQFHCNVQLDGLSEEAERDANVYRIVQEALTNAMKHADAHEIHLDVRVDGKRLVVRVHDDGHGFDPSVSPAEAADTSGMGLLVMRERAALIGGQLAIRSAPDAGGTLIEVIAPLQ